MLIADLAMPARATSVSLNHLQAAHLFLLFPAAPPAAPLLLLDATATGTVNNVILDKAQCANTISVFSRLPPRFLLQSLLQPLLRFLPQSLLPLSNPAFNPQLPPALLPLLFLLDAKLTWTVRSAIPDKTLIADLTTSACSLLPALSQSPPLSAPLSAHPLSLRSPLLLPQLSPSAA